MRLFATELTRLRWRRAVVVLLGACLLTTVVVTVAIAWTTRPVSVAERQRAEQLVQTELARPSFAKEVARCEKRPQQYGVSNPDRCRQQIAPKVEWFLNRSPLDIAEQRRSSGLGLVTVLMGLLMLLGTTFAGADWSSGSMSNQLLFEPRRLRVWAAKGLVVATTAAVTTAVMLAGFWTTLGLLAARWGAETPPEVWDSIVGASLRAVPLVAAASLGAYAVTMLVRSTVFTLGAMFAVAVGATVVMGLLGVSEAWFPNKNLGAVLWNGTTYFVEPPAACFAGGGAPPPGLDCEARAVLGLWTGVRNLGVLLVAAVAVSLWSFRRRDVP